MQILKQISYEPTKVTGGYTDRILRVDLGTLEISIEELPPDFKNKYTGGRGYALKLIWDRTTRQTRYDSPENILVMASGPLGNEPGFPGTGKFIVGTISPLTDTFIDSNIGGQFGPLLKLAGFDAIAVSGISNKEVVILVNGDAQTISIASAPTYGEKTDKGALSFGEKLLSDVNGGTYSDTIAAVTVGQGASTAKFGIVNSLYFDRRRNRIRSKQAGRGGTGTVMRFKGLRSIITRSSLPKANGNNAIDKDGVRKAGTQLKEIVSKHDPEQLNLSAWGTTTLSEYMDKFHLLPINNYQFGQSPQSPKIFAQVFFDNYFSKKLPDGCYYGCNLACAKGAEDIELKRGPRAGQKVGVDGPEYETVGAVTCMGIFNPDFILEYNWYCDEHGIDTISTGVVISFYMECFQRGFLTTEDTGYELKFGDEESASRLIHEIASGEGFGKIAGEGVAFGKKWVVQQAAAKQGTSEDTIMAELDKFGMECKGLEFSMYICKESLAQQGGYGFALKGPQHDEAWLIFIDQVHKELPTFEHKADALRFFPLIRTWFNATGLCKLPWIDVRHPEAANTDNPSRNIPTLNYYVQYLNATTGSSKTLDDVLEDSERLAILQKLINLRQGKGTRVSDQIPLRAMGPAYFNEYESRAEYYEEWLTEQIGTDKVPANLQERHELLIKMRKEAYQTLCDVVYKAKGFTPDAVPTRETVQKFDLMDEQAAKLLAEFGV
ncbi:aldehyde ferredoxin oxidoreductase C-terminal domain-containing protein [Chloroflexota bacterium]